MANISSAHGTITLLGDWTQEDLDAFAPVLKSWEFYGEYGIQYCESFAVDKRTAKFDGCGRWGFDGTLGDFDSWTRDWIRNAPSKTDHPLTTEQYDHFLQLMQEKNLLICFDFENGTGEGYEDDDGEIIEDFFECKGYMYSDGKQLIYTHRNIILTEDGTGIIPEGVEYLETETREWVDLSEENPIQVLRMVIPESFDDDCSCFDKFIVIEKFEVSPDNELYSTDGICLYDKDKTELCYVPSSISEFTIPEGVERIVRGAFSNCKNLIRLYIPESVKEIENTAFDGCKQLSDVSVSERFFEKNNARAFEGTPWLNNITQVQDDVRYWWSIAVACANVNATQIELRAGTTQIGASAFEDCKKLKNITIPEGVTAIGENAFNGCKKLTIHAPAGSFAESFAKEHNIPCINE